MVEQKMNNMTELFCIVGMPAHHSLSPVIQNAALKKHKINGVFLAFDVAKEDLRSAIDGMRAFGIKGITLTSPHKEAVMKYLDNIDSRAKELGAVNTIINNGGRLYGYNTDSPGFIMSLKKYGIDKNAVFTVFGAGGAARAFAFGLAHESITRINIINRTLEHAEKLRDDLKRRFSNLNAKVYQLGSAESRSIISSSKYLINATNITLENRKYTPVPEELLSKDMIVFDANYAPLDNRLLSSAKRKNCVVINGLELLVNQGIVAFELFTGRHFEYEETYKTMMNAAMNEYKKSEKEKK